MEKKISSTQRKGFDRAYSTYESKTITVPRCAKCEAYHRKRSSSNFLIGLGCLAPIGIGFFITFWLATLGTLLNTLIPCVGGIIGIGISVLLAIKSAQSAPGAKNEEHKTEFPAVKELKEKGWTVM